MDVYIYLKSLQTIQLHKLLAVTGVTPITFMHQIQALSF